MITSLLLSFLLGSQIAHAETAVKPVEKAAAKPASKPAEAVKADDGKVTVLDKWFFAEPSSEKQKNRKRTILMVVHNDQDFGFDVKFKTTKKTVNLKIKLTVPKQPGNFPCTDCKAGELKITDDHTVAVNQNIDATSGESFFFWGIGADDPRGKYELSFSLDDKPIETYKFEVK